MKKTSLLFSSKLLALVLVGSAWCAAQTATTNDVNRPAKTDEHGNMRDSNKHDARTGGSMLKRADERFLKKVSHLGEMEVRLSRVAATRAIHPEVKAFAEEMVRAHTAANTEIKDLATRKGVMLDAKDHDKMAKDERKWADKKADDFDEDYMEQMIEDHDDTIDLLTRAAASDDADVAALARKLLPEVKAHAMKAEDLEKRVSR